MPRLRERFEPSFYDADLATYHHGWKVAFENVNHQFKIAALYGVPY
jgi:hypothetical protein